MSSIKTYVAISMSLILGMVVSALLSGSAIGDGWR